MPRSAGVYSLPEAAFVGDTVIDEAAVNNNFSDIGTALTESLAKDGQTDPTANLPMATYRHTGVGNSNARDQYAATGQVQDSAFTWCGTAGGTADALTLTPSPAITTYTARQNFAFISSAANTGAATVAVSGLAATAIQLGGSALSAGDIPNGAYCEVAYDGTQFQLHSVSQAIPSTSGFLTAANNLSDVADAATALGNLSGIKQGTHTIWIPAGAMRPTVSNGCASLTDVETTAGRPDIQVLDFDASADEHAQFQVSFPKSWNEGTITYRVFWTSTATDTDGVTWALQGVACADGDTIDVAYGTAVTVDDANQSTAEDLYVSPTSSAVTIAGSPSTDEIVFFRLFRDVSDANDTAAEDARLIGVQVFYTVNAADDA